MENHTFKSVTFGGFAKQDVIDYIETTAQAAAAAQDALRQERDALQAETEKLAAQLSSQQAQLEVLQTEHDRLERALAEESAARQALEPVRLEAERLTEEAARLTAEAAQLRPDAEAYAQFRERIGAIECEARKRAADLEEITQVKLQGVLERFRSQYTQLMTTFDATATHVNGELRKVEVSLTQLPRAMDQNGRELESLAALLDPKGGET